MKRLVLFVCLLLPATAQALTFAPNASAMVTLPEPGEVAIYQRAAETYWGRTVPCLAVTYEAAPGHEHAVATAELGGCLIYLNPAGWAPWAARWRCDAFVHEFGHLLGYEHTTDMSVMDPFHDRAVPQCRHPAKGSRWQFQRLNRSRS